MEPEDHELVRRSQAGDLDAFAALVRRYERRVRSVLARLLDDKRDVEEATQDVFVQAWRRLDGFRQEASIFTWLYRIAVNEALMRRRRARPRTTELTEAAVAESGGSEEAELRRFLLAKLRELPFEERLALVLHDVQGLSNQEVADVVGISVAAVKSRIHRARMRLRADLEAWES